MTKLVGPCFSLAAVGTLGKVLFYYDSKYGAVVRIPPRQQRNVGQAFEVNKEWFKAASARSKTLNRWQRRAWEVAYPLACDSWRDIFMGHQIEAWNKSHLNDLTWPQISPQDVGSIFWEERIYGALSVQWKVKEWNDNLIRTWTVGSLWWNRLDNAGVPRESDLVKETDVGWNTFSLEVGHTNYLWGGVRYVNGTYKQTYFSSYVR